MSSTHVTKRPATHLVRPTPCPVPVSMSSLKPFDGPTKKLVLALDVGTTFSGVSYVVLEPGKVPIIQGVTRCVFKLPQIETV